MNSCYWIKNSIGNSHSQAAITKGSNLWLRLIQMKPPYKHNCETGFVGNGHYHRSLVKITTKETDCEISPYSPLTNSFLRPELKVKPSGAWRPLTSACVKTGSMGYSRVLPMLLLHSPIMQIRLARVLRISAARPLALMPPF